jgi:hypothetical protein
MEREKIKMNTNGKTEGLWEEDGANFKGTFQMFHVQELRKYRISSPRKLPHAVALLTFMREVSGSSLGRVTDCHILGSRQSLQANAEIIPLPSTSFPIHYSVSSSHSTVEFLVTDSIVKKLD